MVAAFEVAEGAAGADVDRLWSALRQDLVGGFPGSLAAHRDHTLTALLRVAPATSLDRLAERLCELKRPHERRQDVLVSVGVSRLCRAVDEYPDAFEQARHALLIGRAMRGPGSAVTFDELGAQWHLFHVAQQQVRDVYQERLQRLVEHDRAKGTHLFRTVEVYLECMGNAKLAAERLFVHRNTLRLRFQKIRQVAELDVTDPGRWFDLMMALRIIRLRELTARAGHGGARGGDRGSPRSGGGP
ncbi:Purine catabolism regulatory protein [bacterium HR12]|nr:Purine catabolism regulatory protein [bacterium HR12]